MGYLEIEKCNRFQRAGKIKKGEEQFKEDKVLTLVDSAHNKV